MADQEVTIVIKGKNLSGPEFESARKQIAGLKDDGDKAGKAGEGIGTPFKLSFAAIATGAAVAVGAVAAIGAATIALGQRGADVSDIRNQFDVLNRSIG